jgi:hypothetical protein
MLRPWVPLIALALLMALGWQLGNGFLAALGGCLLAAALVSQALSGFGPAWERLGSAFRRRRSMERAAHLDWTVIDNSVGGERVKRDCERPETLGICTGMECLVYKTCNFNIKKPLP